MTKTRIEICTETCEVLRIKSRGMNCHSRCPECFGQALMLAPEQAALAANLTVRQVYQLVETGKIHFIERGGGKLLICLNSLSKNV